MRGPDHLTDRFTMSHTSRKMLARRILKHSY